MTSDPGDQGATPAHAPDYIWPEPQAGTCMAIILSDAGRWKHLLPLTFTRPVGALRPGIFTMAEAWGSLAQQATGYNTEAYLATKFPAASADIVREVDATL